MPARFRTAVGVRTSTLDPVRMDGSAPRGKINEQRWILTPAPAPGVRARATDPANGCVIDTARGGKWETTRWQTSLSARPLSRWQGEMIALQTQGRALGPIADPCWQRREVTGPGMRAWRVS
jgi:hypothetical protein